MEKSYTIVITTLFGIESVTASELEEMGYARDFIQVRDGMVSLRVVGLDPARQAVARLNIGLRTAERILFQLAEFPARDFDALFEQTSSLPWEEWLTRGAAFHVNGYSRKSVLFGIPACQRIIKKAIVSRLARHYKLIEGERVPEDPSLGLVRIQFGIVSDQVSMMIDTSGDGLHKRGYRPLRHEAPIKETLAAAMLYLSRFGLAGEKEGLVDPFCGSGTIPIEAALIASKTAPGLHRRFAGEAWPFIGIKCFDQARQEAATQILTTEPDPIRIFGSDLDSKAVGLAIDNAHRAGVSKWVRFRAQDIHAISGSSLAEWSGLPYHLIVCNPPYGERLLDNKQAEALYRALADWTLDPAGKARPGIRLSVITPDEQFEALVGGRADKRRKLYNGMIRCTMYHYFKQSRTNTNYDRGN